MAAKFSIQSGPTPGLLGDVAALHGRYYAEHWDFPVAFEDKVAREMGGFLCRYDPAKDLVLWTGDPNRVLGTITLDGSDPELLDGWAHLRWFILHESLAGQGLGKVMIDRVVAFARDVGYRAIYLTTFDGLHAAMALYRRAGFQVVDEQEGETWGRSVLEQRLELTF
ncbi:MAG: GNAT family N-acetyltransferase [Alphaproteobacteria bacterium]|nr:GNAT family N-acetyltransferase [Alphaproteobacteria bacterium]